MKRFSPPDNRDDNSQETIVVNSMDQELHTLVEAGRISRADILSSTAFSGTFEPKRIIRG